MRIKDLFTVPEGKKVTEKAFAKVLISSICSILLCMACLVSTTWAWFAVSIENTENVIHIGDADVKVIVNNSTVAFENGAQLPAGDCSITIENNNQPDDFKKKATLYVTLYFDGEAAGYVVLDDGSGYKTTVNGKVGEAIKFSWIESWFPPIGIGFLSSEIDYLNATESATEATTATTTEPPTETTGATNPSIEETTANPSTEPSTESTSPSTEPSTEATTTPVTEPEITHTVSGSTETTVAAVPSEETISTSTTESTGEEESME